MIYPINVPQAGLCLNDVRYPDTMMLQVLFDGCNTHDLQGFARLYFTEGIPFAFRQNPLAYEIIRDWISKQLGEEPKHITLVGSARIGYSMKPKKWGQCFGDHSDLDFTIVSQRLFQKLVWDFRQWIKDLEVGLSRRGRIDIIYQKYLENVRLIDDNIEKGFIDPNKIQNIQRYRSVNQSLEVMDHLTKRINISPGVPKCSRASIRVYVNWQACVEQLERTLKWAVSNLSSRGSNVVAPIGIR